jgi:hypothetical protein
VTKFKVQHALEASPQPAGKAGWMNGLLILGLLLAASAVADGADWVRPGLSTNQPVWGLRGGLLWAVAPAGFRGGEPRGMVRLGYPVLGNQRYDLINFIAIEPVVQGRRGFSELERSQLDGLNGKPIRAEGSGESALTSAAAGDLWKSADGGEELEVKLVEMQERFRDGQTFIFGITRRTPQELGALHFHFEARLKRSVLVNSNDYSPSLHAAQYFVYFTVANRNPKAAGYGECFWFGIPIYDNRHRLVPAYEAQDFGETKLFIFTPASESFARASTHDGEWVTIERDLLPLMRQGVEHARAKGFIKGSPGLADYRPLGIFIGWEVPGMFDAGLQIRNLSLKARSRPRL